MGNLERQRHLEAIETLLLQVQSWMMILIWRSCLVKIILKSVIIMEADILYKQ